MSAVLAGQKQRWIAAVAGAAFIVVAVLTLFRLPPPPELLRPPSAPVAGATVKHAVQLAAPADQLLRDETELHDLRPLFLPTERNVRPAELKREPGRTFLDRDGVKLSFPENDLGLSRDFPPVATVAGARADEATPLDALASEASAVSWFGIGRAQVRVARLEPRGGYLEVLSAATGERVLSAVFSVADGRPASEKPWSPLELFARIEPVGLAAPLVVTTSSGIEEVDVYFRKFLARTYRLGERLEPGFYRVIVAP